MKRQWVPCSLTEEGEAAPAMGATPPSPTNPDIGGDKGKTNKHHFDFLQRGLGIDKEDFEAAIQTGNVEFLKCPDYSDKWGFIVNGPVTANVEEEPSGSGNYKVTFLLDVLPKNSFFMPKWNKNQYTTEIPYYTGPIENKVEYMSKEELQDMLAMPFEKGGGAPAGGGMGGPGGPGGAGGPPGGGGAPPPAPGGAGGM